nr:MAG TPA: hypothetical protein [Caudoviricetes sp.]DAN50970.1 MAG TPA: hypothetical protein [Caudoviricetes sp.]DAP21141.1 MAG TPA: hypothetical protein [Caudoviricetes sp.]
MAPQQNAHNSTSKCTWNACVKCLITRFFYVALYPLSDKGLFQSFRVPNRYSLENQNTKRWQKIILLIIR